jgi:hypothetical protein
MPQRIMVLKPYLGRSALHIFLAPALVTGPEIKWEATLSKVHMISK